MSYCKNVYQFGVLGGRRGDDYVQLIVDLGRNCWDGHVTVLVDLVDGVIHDVLTVADFSEVSPIVPETRSEKPLSWEDGELFHNYW